MSLLRHITTTPAALIALAATAVLCFATSTDLAAAGGNKKTASGPPFAFLCLNSERIPDVEEMQRLLDKWLAADSGKAVTDLQISTDNALTISFAFDGHRFVAGLIDKPIPQADIDYACANAFFWPEASEVLKRHSSHLIVTALGDYDKPWQRALRISQVMAACIESFDSAGVYWGHASVVHSPAFFLQGVREAGTDVAHLPVELWTGFLRTERSDQTVDMYTDGLDVFGCMEFEIVESDQPMSELFEMLMGMSRYVIFNGNVIHDGDSVGGDAEEKIATHYAKSVIGRPAAVIRIDY